MRSDFLLLIWFSFFESTVARGGHSTSSFVDSRTHYDTTMSHSHSHGNISSSTPATSLSTKTTTTPNGSEFLSEETVENPDISGCSWPKDYLTRLDFCQRRAELTGKAVRHGSFAALNNGILSNLLEDCRRHHLQCGRINASDHEYEAYVDFWKNNTDRLITLESCLKQNTKGMVDLCGGSESKIGRVVSGAGGLHLNLLNILIGIATDLRLTNATQDCLIRAAISVHLTAAVYIHSKSYQDNSVMCWDIKENSCNSVCSQFASSLSCLSYSCDSFTQDYFKQFGIWQWYFNDQQKIIDFCSLDSSHKCQKDPNSKIIGLGLGNSFSEKAVRKLKEIQGVLEAYFHRPIYTIASLFAGAVLLLIVIITVLCIWYQGKMPRRSRVIRYKILGEKPERGETQSLAVENEFDDVE